MTSAKVVRLLEVQSVCGAGTKADPCRTITQYFTERGKLVFTLDQMCDTLRDVQDHESDCDLKAWK